MLRDGRNASQVAADVHVPGRGPGAARPRRVRARARHATSRSRTCRCPKCRCPHQIDAAGPARPPEPVRRDPVPRADRVAAGEPARRSRARPVRVVGAARTRAAPRRRLARPAPARGARRRARSRGRPRARPARAADDGAVARDRHPLHRDAGRRRGCCRRSRRGTSATATRPARRACGTKRCNLCAIATQTAHLRTFTPDAASVVAEPASQSVPAQRRARDQHRPLEAGLAVLVGLLVVGRGHHVDERLAARVLHERDRVPVVRVFGTDQHLVGAAHPEHLAALRFDHSDDGVAVLAVLGRTRCARCRAVGRFLLELQEVEHHDRTLVGRAREREELVFVGRIPLIGLLPSSSAVTCVRARARPRAVEQPCAVRSRFQVSHASVASSASSVSSSRSGNASSSWRRSRRSSRARFDLIAGESCTLEQRGATDGRDASKTPARRSMISATRSWRRAWRRHRLQQRREPLPLPLRDFGAQRLDVGEVVVHRSGRHAGARRDLFDARTQAARLVARRAGRR